MRGKNERGNTERRSAKGEGGKDAPNRNDNHKNNEAVFYISGFAYF